MRYFSHLLQTSLFAAVLLAYTGTVQAATVTNVTVNNFSNANHIQATGNSVVKEYASDILNVTPVTVNGAESTFGAQFGFFQDMRVDQPAAPNFALIYRHNIGYEINFTVEDPLNEGYTIDVDQLLRGHVTVSREEPIQAGMSAGLMLGRLNGTHYAGFYIGGDGVNVTKDDPNPLQTKRTEKVKHFSAPASYTGTQTFTVSFSSFPSPALVNVFQNFGGGEGVAQFGILPTRPEFQYGNDTGTDALSDLGHFSTVTVTSLGPVCTPTDEVCDGEDNDCDGEIDEGVDTDNDGVEECFGEDVCLGTQLEDPAQGLNPKHYAQLDGDEYFEEGCNGKNCTPADSQYTLSDTRGCSCEQIIALLPGKKLGLVKNGCTESLLLKWINQ